MTATLGSIADMRAGIAYNLSSASVNVYPYAVEAPAVPAIVILDADPIIYDTTMARGADLYTFSALLIAQRADLPGAQAALDGFLSKTGIKADIESDPTLGGAAQTCRLTTADNYTAIQVAGVEYLTAMLTIEVYA